MLSDVVRIVVRQDGTISSYDQVLVRSIVSGIMSAAGIGPDEDLEESVAGAVFRSCEAACGNGRTDSIGEDLVRALARSAINSYHLKEK